MRVTLFQLDLAWEDPSANLAKVAAACERRDLTPGELIVLPEMSNLAFSVAGAPSLTEKEDGVSVRGLQELAHRWNVRFVAGLALADAQGIPRNCSVLIGPEGILHRYHKLQPFSPSGESEAYPAGGEVMVTTLDGFLYSPFICYDLRFPEIFRPAAAAGAVLFTVIASWPEARTEHWRVLLRARAIENQAFVIGVNRAGTDPFFRYPGRSAVIDPLGNAVLELGDAEAFESVEIRLDDAVEWRAKFPALRDRRAAEPRVVTAPR
jgi:predicted amidohydrolase